PPPTRPPLCPYTTLFRSLVRRTDGAILEIGAGDGALTKPLAQLGRRLTAIELDEHRARRLARELSNVAVKRADALAHPLHDPVRSEEHTSELQSRENLVC